ncbi:hypothetical protein B0H14DRAFT_856885 [Mycena olivaceomarginata]|nr:hypothetical protein B0H14DRAFT_856885 [Mycena olivaceomarginata]
MLPVADSFNFVVCGFATLAASVGYAYARKTRPLPSRGVPQPLDLLGDNDSISNSAPGPSGSLEKPRDEYSEATPLLSSSTVLEKSTEEDQNGIAITAESVLESTPAAVNETTVLSKHNSLKRKRTHERDETDPDMGYPHNLRSIYPNKRRSGSVSEEEPTKDVVRSVQLLVERLILMVLLGGDGRRTL